MTTKRRKDTIRSAQNRDPSMADELRGRHGNTPRCISSAFVLQALALPLEGSHRRGSSSSAVDGHLAKSKFVFTKSLTHSRQKRGGGEGEALVSHLESSVRKKASQIRC